MKYEISVSDRDTYLHVRINEPLTPQLLKDFIGETSEKAKECGINNFLFDLRHAPNRTSLVAHFNMVFMQSKKLGFKPQTKHALLIGQKDMDDYRFVETILDNAGYKSKMFLDELSAADWLDKINSH